uniref:Uncharacterized protein n=1 Tax=Aegilops tauschii subsp. strangulata TaxID=200361 RepID=A0A453NDI4_AEGTS
LLSVPLLKKWFSGINRHLGPSIFLAQRNSVHSDLAMAIKLIAIAFFLLLLAFAECSDGGEPPSSQKETFGETVYAVHWDSPSKGEGFGASAYKVDWNPEDAPSREQGFWASPYKVDWKLDDA